MVKNLFLKSFSQVKYFILIFSLILQSVAFAPKAWAQYDSDEYDPFADYSEFEEASEEEADIHFFRNGRFFNLGFLFGQRGFTESMGQLYTSSPNYGIFLTFFFDLHFATQFTFLTGDHPFSLYYSPTVYRTGNVSMTEKHISLKYYFNTQNVTKGLANLNPYLIGGISMLDRTFFVTDPNSSESSIPSRDGVFGAHLGAGLEVPMMRNKMYFGLQAVYQYANFPQENSAIRLSGPSGVITTNFVPQGDVYNLTAILGINF